MTPTKHEFFLGFADGSEYPDRAHGFAATRNYPESRLPAKGSLPANDVYDLVREGFARLGYDSERFGTPEWNPLGDLIEPGSTVLVKPNWVLHENRNLENPHDLECLVTHPSLVRAVVDYVQIALNGTGRIILGDAPMQGCDLEKLFDRSGYRELFEYFRQSGIPVEVRDLRQIRVNPHLGVISPPIVVNDISQSVLVDVSDYTSHRRDLAARYKVSDYTAKATASYHHGPTHKYSISRAALEADVIINLPKPKTHRLTGMTGARKNFVGLIFDKASLPHRTLGSLDSGGDEYPYRSVVKSTMTQLEEAKLNAVMGGKSARAFLFQIGVAALWVATKYLLSDKVLLGSWHGNDTTWRMVDDLLFVARFADKEGNIRTCPQRKLLNIGDMIIGGQGNGPVSPNPKSLGIVLIGADPIFFDLACAIIMGLDVQKVPGLVRATRRLTAGGHEYTVLSNRSQYDRLSFSAFTPDPQWAFEPHQDWVGHLEARPN